MVIGRTENRRGGKRDAEYRDQIYMEVWMTRKEDRFRKDRQHRETSAQKNSYRV